MCFLLDIYLYLLGEIRVVEQFLGKLGLHLLIFVIFLVKRFICYRISLRLISGFSRSKRMSAILGRIAEALNITVFPKVSCHDPVILVDSCTCPWIDMCG